MSRGEAEGDGPLVVAWFRLQQAHSVEADKAPAKSSSKVPRHTTVNLHLPDIPDALARM